MALSAYGTGGGNRTAFHADLYLLERARPWATLLKFADKKPVPMNRSESVKWRRVINPDVSLVQVTEGSNPAERQIAYEDFQGTFQEFAEIYVHSSRATELREDDVVQDSADVLRDLIIRTKERNAWNTYIAGTQVAYNAAAHTVRTQVDGPITLGRLQLAVTEIEAAQGEPYTEIDDGSDRIDTRTIEPCYLVFVHTHAGPDIRALPGFTPTASYGGGAKSVVCPYEFGAVENMRFIKTPHLRPIADAGATASGTGMRTSGTKVDVYPYLVMAKHAVGCADLLGSGQYGYGGIEVDVIGGKSKSDPTNQRTYVSARWWDLPIILNNNWVYRIECGATLNPT